MLTLLFFTIPFAASAHLTAISYGQIEPVQTLVPRISPELTLSDNEIQVSHDAGADSDGFFHNMTNMEILRELVRSEEEPEVATWDVEGNKSMHTYLNAERTADDLREHPASHNNTEILSESSHLVRRSNILEAKDITTYKNRMQVDCRKGPEICNQVCWFQNCVTGDEGEVQYPEYAIGYDADSGKDRAKDSAAQNRPKSGVKTSRGPPCMTWPMGQKFWDTYAFPKAQKLKAKGKDSTQYLG